MLILFARYGRVLLSSKWQFDWQPFSTQAEKCDAYTIVFFTVAPASFVAAAVIANQVFIINYVLSLCLCLPDYHCSVLNLEYLQLELIPSFAYHSLRNSVYTHFHILPALYILYFCFFSDPQPSSTQPDELTNVLEICNIVFTSMFTLEMILKLTAFGFFEYLRNPYNIFDGIIVIIRSAVYKIICWLSCLSP